MAIRSPYNSFVDFNQEVLDCAGDTRQAALPVINTFAIKFQFKVDAELLPTTTAFYAGICSEGCQLVLDTNTAAIPICIHYILLDQAGLPLEVNDFPVTISNYTPSGDQPKVPSGVYTKDQLLQAISDTYDFVLPSHDYIACCDQPVISGIPVTTADSQVKTIGFNEFYAHGYFSIGAISMSGIVSPTQCFRYCILNAAKQVISCSNLFYRETELCYTTLLTYYNEENGYGFRYMPYDSGGSTLFTENTIRLPFYLRRPGFQITENIFRRSDGVKQRTSTVIEKDWLGTVGYLSVEQHEKLTVALKHDYVHVDNEFSGVNYRMTQEGEYTPGYTDELNTVLSPAEFRISDYSHNYVNNNCGFNCGIEMTIDCEGGGLTPQCPDKFSFEFVLSEGQETYQDGVLIGVTADQIEVYREGLLQYTTGVNYYSHNPSTGTLTLFPVGYAGERVAIVEI